MLRHRLIQCLCGLVIAAAARSLAADVPAAPAREPAMPGWLTQPLTLLDCLNLALSNNSAILKSQHDLAATHGLIVQTRAIAWPKVVMAGQYQANDENAIEKWPVPEEYIQLGYPAHQWSASITLRQSIYEGGKVRSALRSARILREQARYQHEAVVADTILAVRLAYYDGLLAEQQIVVQEASIDLLVKELEDTTHRFEAGTVPRFNVLRAEVELANARPQLIRAKNAHRIAKNNLANLLGFNLPKEIWEDIPFTLLDRLEYVPWEIELPTAITKALERRPELAALHRFVAFRREDIQLAKSGYKPALQITGGYGSRSSTFRNNLSYEISGWFAGAEASWNLFDGLQTKGKIQEAKAKFEKAQEDVLDTTRAIELEVRTAYSNFIEAKEIYESQKKVQEQAEEAFRLATARYEAGTGTQLDALSAQTALTAARTILVQSVHDCTKTRAQLERAMGLLFPQEDPPAF